jgi:hypothetical protein
MLSKNTTSFFEMSCDSKGFCFKWTAKAVARDGASFKR